MDKLKEFMMIFRLEPSPEPATAEQVEQTHRQWGAFIGSIASQGKLLGTHRLKLEGKLLSQASGLKDEIVVSSNQVITGNMILKAESMEEVAEIAKQCPIIFAAGSVELREINPM